jgi:hypothetical protein
MSVAVREVLAETEHLEQRSPRVEGRIAMDTWLERRTGVPCCPFTRAGAASGSSLKANRPNSPCPNSKR